MELYYHKTDGGAEYYSTEYITCPNGEKEGDIGYPNTVLRTDGNEIQVFASALKQQRIPLVINGVPFSNYTQYNEKDELQFWKDLAENAIDALADIYDHIHYVTCDNDSDAEDATDFLLTEKLGINNYVLDAIQHGEDDIAYARHLGKEIDF